MTPDNGGRQVLSDEREHDVIDETLEKSLMFVCESGVYVFYEDSDGFEHSWDDIVELTLEMPYDDHVEDLAAVVAGLRAAADRIEKGSREPPRFKP